MWKKLNLLVSFAGRVSRALSTNYPRWTHSQAPVEPSLAYEEPSSSWSLLLATLIFLLTGQRRESCAFSEHLFRAPERSCCCRETLSPHRALHMERNLACSGMSSCIPRASLTTLPPQCPAGLSAVADTLP
jgi:hypothetical protein